MSQRRRTQKSLTQPSTSTRITHDEDDEDDVSRSQSQRNKNFSDAERSQYVANAVRYILAADLTKTPISKSTVSKAIECSGVGFRSIMNSAEQILEDVFGYRIIEIRNNETSTGKFILVNKLQGTLPDETIDKAVGDRYVLLFLVLSHIFMSGDMCNEASLLKFLQKLGIIEEGNTNNDLFGNVLDLITNVFVKERYIKAETNENCEIQEKDYSWGERALEELSPRLVMEFACKIYGEREPQSWPQQFKRMQTLVEEHSHVQRQNGTI